MTQEYTMRIECADNGMIVRDDESIEVIEEVHDVDDADRTNLKARLGEIFLGEIEHYLNQTCENIAKVTIKIEKDGADEQRKANVGVTSAPTFGSGRKGLYIRSAEIRSEPMEKS